MAMPDAAPVEAFVEAPAPADAENDYHEAATAEAAQVEGFTDSSYAASAPSDADDTDPAMTSVVAPTEIEHHEAAYTEVGHAEAAHALTSEEIDAQHEQQGDAVGHVVEDDDTLALPAAPLEYLGHSPPARRKPKKAARGNSTAFRQTIVPILLVVAFMMIVFGTMKFLVNDESPMVELPTWMSLAAYGVAVVLLGLAVVNMLFIRQELATAAAKEAAKA